MNEHDSYSRSCKTALYPHISFQTSLLFLVSSRKKAMEEAYRTLHGLCQGLMASQEDKDELEMEALIEEHEAREREEANMEYESADDLSSEDDVEIVVIQDVESENGSEENSITGEIRGSDSEGDSEGNRQRDGEEESGSGRKEEDSTSENGGSNTGGESEGNIKGTGRRKARGKVRAK